MTAVALVVGTLAAMAIGAWVLARVTLRFEQRQQRARRRDGSGQGPPR